MLSHFAGVVSHPAGVAPHYTGAVSDSAGAGVQSGDLRGGPVATRELHAASHTGRRRGSAQPHLRFVVVARDPPPPAPLDQQALPAAAVVVVVVVVGWNTLKNGRRKAVL